MCFDNDEQSTVWHQKIVKARKKHGCFDCGSGILPGEHYKRIGSLYEGRWDTLRLCARCVWDHARVYAHEISEGCAPGESHCPLGYLQEYMEDQAREARWALANAGEIDEDDDDAPTVWDASPITYRQVAA